MQDPNDQVITVDDLTDQHWAEIRVIAIHLIDKGIEPNQMKASVIAFLEWLKTKDFLVAVDVDEDPGLSGIVVH